MNQQRNCPVHCGGIKKKKKKKVKTTDFDPKSNQSNFHRKELILIDWFCEFWLIFEIFKFCHLFLKTKEWQGKWILWLLSVVIQSFVVFCTHFTQNLHYLFIGYGVLFQLHKRLSLQCENERSFC